MQVINTTNIVAIQVIIGPLSMCTRLFQLISRFFRIDQLSKEDSILVCPGSFTKYVLFFAYVDIINVRTKMDTLERDKVIAPGQCRVLPTS